SGTFNIVDLVAHEMETRVVTFDAAGISVLDVSDDAGSVTIQSADVDQITVRARIGHGLRRSGSSVEVQGDRLVVRGSCPVIGSQWCDVRYTIEVPADVDVVVDGDSDRITVTGMTGTVQLHSDNGSIHASRLSGDLQLSADNGSIHGTELTSRSVHADSDNGSIELQLTTPPQTIDVTTDNGNIVVELPSGNEVYAVDISSDNGSTDNGLRTDPASDRTVVATTDNGDVTLRYTG
ncbi:MAG: putative lipoprotein, partial [Ilumatobacteraceae bacterium]|nr:putative lipoprotein [Ilumatobacteraceae bacterium]